MSQELQELTSQDQALFHVLKECKTLPMFLDTVFGFLKRNTDFYVIADGPDATMGLPSQMAADIVKATFFKWFAEETNNLQCVTEPEPPVATQEVEISDVPIVDLQISPQIASPQEHFSPAVSSECYNGAVKDNYMWSQTINDLSIVVPLAEGIGPRQLAMKIEGKHISVKNKLNLQDVLVGELPHCIKHTEAIWWVAMNKLEMQLDKVQERWWDRLFIGDEPLNVSKLDCSRPFDELSEEAKAKIEELQYNQDRRRNGLPTTQQLRMQATLKNAWNVDGSPFSGPFDSSKVVLEN